MVDGGIPDPVFADPLPVLPGDPIILANEHTGGDPAEADHDFRIDQADLFHEPADAGLLFFFFGDWHCLDVFWALYYLYVC